MSQATDTDLGEIVLSGDLTGTGAYPELRASGVTPGTYGPVSKWYVDAKGRTTSIATMTPAEIADAVQTASYVQRGVLRTGHNINNSSGTISVNTASSSVRGLFTVQSPLVSSSGTVTLDYGAMPAASASTKGIMQVGSGLDVSSGTISRTVPDATTSVKGKVQVGTNINVSGGTISLGVGDATTSTKGLVQIGDFLKVVDGVVSVPYASTTEKGVVKIGTGFTISGGSLISNQGNGTTSNPGFLQYSNEFMDIPGLLMLPIADVNRLGLAVISSASPYLSISSGVLSYAVPDATSSSKGLVQIGSGLSVASGVVSADPIPDATTSSKGVIQAGTGINITAGTLSVTHPDATESSKGVIQVGTGMSVSSGTVSLDTPPDATTISKGIISVSSSDTYLSVSSGVLTFAFPDATGSVNGVVQIAANGGIDVVSGVISSQLATSSLKGIAQAGTRITATGNQLSLGVTDATTSAAGIVQFNPSNFSVTDGVASLNTALGDTTLGVVSPTDSTNLTISSGLIDVGTNIPKKNVANTYTQAQVSALVTNTYSASYAPDFSASNTFEMVLTGNVSLANPTNVVAGGVYSIILQQDGFGSRTLTISGSAYKTNQTITLSTTAGKRDVLTLVCKSSTEIYVLYVPGF